MYFHFVKIICFSKQLRLLNIYYIYLSKSLMGSYSEVKLSDSVLILGGVSFGRETLE